MDGFEVLHQMHEEAKATFQKISAASPNERAGLWAKLRPELMLHEQMEERFIYDPVAEAAKGKNPGLESWHSEHHKEVGEAESLMGKIGDQDTTSAQWLATVKELQQALEKHIQEEETDAWPRIRSFWGEDKVQGVTTQLQAAKAAGSAGAAVSGAAGAAVQSVKNAVSGH